MRHPTHSSARRCRRWRKPRVSISDRRLCRIPSRGRIAGVCAGLAEYFSVSTTMMRFAAVTALIFAPQITLIAYLLAIFLMPTREAVDAENRLLDDGDGDFEQHMAEERRRQREFDRSLHGSEADTQSLDDRRRLVRQARERLARIEARIQGLERYVTSPRFELDNEIKQL
jgi:phage shock protein C